MEPELMARRQPLTVRQRRLAAELLALRGSTPREKVVEDTGVSEGALLKMEKGRTRPQRRTLVTLLDYYGAAPEKRAELLDLWQKSTRASDLQPIEESLPENYQTFIAFESEAARLSVFEGFFVPGLLQTEEYARALIRNHLPEQEEDGVRARVEVRLRRQEALRRDNSVRLWAVMDEAVIRRVVGGSAVMRQQLEHLAAASRTANTVTLQIIPFSAGAHTGMTGAFQLMDFGPPDPPLVYTENLSGGLFLESPDDVDLYRAHFERLVALALNSQQTAQMIEDAAKAV